MLDSSKVSLALTVGWESKVWLSRLVAAEVESSTTRIVNCPASKRWYSPKVLVVPTVMVEYPPVWTGITTLVTVLKA